MGKDRKLEAALEQTRQLKEEANLRLQEQNEFFNTEQTGFIQTETERERTLKVTQRELKTILPIQNANDIFNLHLPDFGPYQLDITRNGKYLLLGGRKGHLAMLDWKSKNLVCEFQAKDKVRDVQFLQNQTMFATAQSKYLHIYDNQGIELHCMRDYNDPVKLEYLPYHFLLVAGSKLGTIRWLDVSMGQTAAEARTKKGEMLCMTHNRMNGVLALGHSNGEVTMWTPNMGSTPVVKLLAHPAAPVNDVAISRNGTYMATVGKDSRLKIWDIRSTYKCLYDYFTPAPASCVDWSDKGLVSCAFGNEV